MKEYANYDAVGLAELVRKGEVSARELLDAAMARIDDVNPQINAVIHTFYDEAVQAINAGLPEGPFTGVPFLLKDLISEVKGQPLRMGSGLFADYVPNFDSELTKRLRQSGLVLFGKTNTPEFGTLPITDPVTQGSTLNPVDPSRSPGGSSGGSAAAVAAGMVPMASGGDGGGSIRIPAACCGLVGMKPTRGRVPTGPNRGDVWYGMVSEGVLTRSVRDSAAWLGAVTAAGPGAGPANTPPLPSMSFLQATQTAPKKLRIAYTTGPMLSRNDVDPECVKAVEQTVQQLRDLGHQVVEAHPEFDRETFIFAFAVLVAADTAAVIRWGEQLRGKKAGRNDLELHNRAFIKLGEAFTSRQVVEALRQIDQLKRSVGEFMEDYDVLLSPTQPIPSPVPGQLALTGKDKIAAQALANLPIGKIATQRSLIIDSASTVYDFMSHTPLANATGQPSVSLPLYNTPEGLPVGVMLTGRFADEVTLYQLAGQLES